tara:strand:- start:428 stop:604 length:177 start_codon:yes stop_codon:yes gene_type:complete
MKPASVELGLDSGLAEAFEGLAARFQLIDPVNRSVDGSSTILSLFTSLFIFCSSKSSR